MHAMLKRAFSRLSSGSCDDSGGSDTTSRRTSRRPRPSDDGFMLGTPVVRLALSKVAKGHAAKSVPEAARALIEECGEDNASTSA